MTRDHIKLVTGLLPAFGITVLFTEWFVVGFMEHGWLGHGRADCSDPTLHLFQFVAVVLASVGFAASVVLGLSEAGKAWGRLRS